MKTLDIQFDCLHGFLGLPSDFDPLCIELEKRIRIIAKKSSPRVVEKEVDCVDSIKFNESEFSEVKVSFNRIDYYRIDELSPRIPWDGWPESFYRWLSKRKGFSQIENCLQNHIHSEKDAEKDFSEKTQLGNAIIKKKILIGYSQGGRLATHFFNKYKNVYDYLVLISSGLGLQESEREARRKQDEKWAHLFLESDFNQALKLWNEQEIFRSSKREPPRSENQFNRFLLSENLKNWSLAYQNDFRSFFAEASIPILYVTGEKDLKYTRYGKEISALNSRISHQIIPKAGHRTHWDCPAEVAEQIWYFCKSQFFKSITSLD